MVAAPQDHHAGLKAQKGNESHGLVRQHESKILHEIEKYGSCTCFGLQFGVSASHDGSRQILISHPSKGHIGEMMLPDGDVAVQDIVPTLSLNGNVRAKDEFLDCHDETDIKWDSLACRNNALPLRPHPEDDETVQPVQIAPVMPGFRIDSVEEVKQFYMNRLLKIQQTGLKKLIKIWIKVICPKKQAIFPYARKGDETVPIPGYWPDTTEEKGCRFREPDHIRKGERMRLAVHLLLLCPSPEQLRKWNNGVPDVNAMHHEQGWTAMLRSVAGSDVFDGLTAEPKAKTEMRRRNLAELYRVNQLWEGYKNGERDGTTFHNYPADSGDRPTAAQKRSHRHVSVASTVAENSRESTPFARIESKPKKMRRDAVTTVLPRAGEHLTDRMEGVDLQEGKPLMLAISTADSSFASSHTDHDGARYDPSIPPRGLHVGPSHPVLRVNTHIPSMGYTLDDPRLAGVSSLTSNFRSYHSSAAQSPAPSNAPTEYFDQAEMGGHYNFAGGPEYQPLTEVRRWPSPAPSTAATETFDQAGCDAYTIKNAPSMFPGNHDYAFAHGNPPFSPMCVDDFHSFGSAQDFPMPGSYGPGPTSAAMMPNSMYGLPAPLPPQQQSFAVRPADYHEHAPFAGMPLYTHVPELHEPPEQVMHSAHGLPRTPTHTCSWSNRRFTGYSSGVGGGQPT